VGWQSGGQVQAAPNPVCPDIVIIQDPLPDMPSEDFAVWCKRQYPQMMCIILGSDSSEQRTFSHVMQVDAYMAKGCDPLNLISFCEKGRWERALSRVEHLLDVRTDDLRESEAQFKGLFETLPDVLVIYDHQVDRLAGMLLGCWLAGWLMAGWRARGRPEIFSYTV